MGDVLRKDCDIYNISVCSSVVDKLIFTTVRHLCCFTVCGKIQANYLDQREKTLNYIERARARLVITYLVLTC